MNDDDQLSLHLEWAPALSNLYKGHPDNFCELLRDYQFPVPDEVRDWIAGIFDGTKKAPPKRRQRNTADVWELQAVRVAAVKYLKLQRSGAGRTQLASQRKEAIYGHADRYGREPDTVAKWFKVALARLKREQRV